MLCFSARILNVQINIQKYIKNYTICLYHMTTQFLAKLQLVVNCQFWKTSTEFWSRPISRHFLRLFFFLWQSLAPKKVQENLSSSSAMVLLDWKCWSRFECWLIWGNQNGIFITSATSNKTVTQWYKEVHPQIWNDLPASKMVYQSFMAETF